MSTEAATITQDCLTQLTSGVLPDVAQRIMKAYYLGAAEGLDIGKTLQKRADSKPTSDNSDLPMMLRNQAD